MQQGHGLTMWDLLVWGPARTERVMMELSAPPRATIR